MIKMVLTRLNRAFFYFLPLFLLVWRPQVTLAQRGYVISGKVVAGSDHRPLQAATVHLVGSGFSTLTRMDGSFRMVTDKWYDSMEVSNVGYQTLREAMQKNHTQGLTITLAEKNDVLASVVIPVLKKPGKSFMERVIENKNANNPSRFRSYSYQRYTRNELDIDRIDYLKARGKGLKSLMLKIYAGLDSNAILDKELPIYFKEWLANDYHSVSPHIDRENIIARKSLGLKTDEFISRLDKFYFNFNIYDDWLAVFDQTYVSPLNSHAFNYYKFFVGDTTTDGGDTTVEVRFIPLRNYERAFSGFLWINTSSLAVTSVEMHMNQTAHINFVNDIRYDEDYSRVYDSTSDAEVWMPHKFTSTVKFVSGLALLGLPDPSNKTQLQFVIRNTTVTDRMRLNLGEPTAVVAQLINKEKTTSWNKPESFWEKNRPDSLTQHEKD
ncbi:MAG: carboxypeptidase-like regulatory domain-containing protein, partial [Bacteroidota bacterium]|nr:carboxypeptidase-like regulatory domain-containing protein [Bacteroidota bacterium]